MYVDEASTLDPVAQRTRWDLACLSLALIKQDPIGLKGMLIQGARGPVHQAFQTLLNENFVLREIPATISEEGLRGGIDISQTLVQKRRVYHHGLLSLNQTALLCNGAERLDSSTLGILANHLDSLQNPTGAPVFLFDESLENEESTLTGTALVEQLAVKLTLPHLPLQHLSEAVNALQNHEDYRLSDIQPATEKVRHIDVPENFFAELTTIAYQLGVVSLRPVLYALQIAKGHALLQSRDCIDLSDATIAIQLAIAPRATRLPQAADEEATDEAEAPPDQEGAETESEHHDRENYPDEQPRADQSQLEKSEEEQLLEDAEMSEQLLEAIEATLPQHLIANLAKGSARSAAKGRDASTSFKGSTGRPCGVRKARGDFRRQKLNIIETLKAAIPKQKLRQNPTSHNKGNSALQIRREDFCITRYKQPSRTTTVFVVDASGSAALHRLAEAKGAVELLLAECYVRRDRVALISFKGETATLELEPTRSLVRAKRQLSGLPGGGGTPLATGIDLAHQVAKQLLQAGENPVVVFMTDGKANINRLGKPSRAEALQDAELAAESLALLSVKTLFIDTSPRARPQAAVLASKMKAQYLPLPHSALTKIPELISAA